MTDQISIFDGDKPLKIDKPIRLIELFAGYGSQALALKYLGIPFEHYKISEWAVPSIKAYKDMHFGDDSTDYSASMTKDDLVNYFALAQPAELPGGSYKYMQDLRIRKLTEREVFRLQGVKGEDFEKIAKSISKSLLYHLAGDSIEVSCLMAIFGMMLDVDWKRKIDDLVEDI